MRLRPSVSHHIPSSFIAARMLTTGVTLALAFTAHKSNLPVPKKSCTSRPIITSFRGIASHTARRLPPTSLHASRPRSSPSSLHNVPYEDALEVELDEMEAELNVTKPVGDYVGEGKAPPMRTRDAVSIIAGTAVGGGFLAIPSLISPIGYLPAACGLVVSWVFLTLSAIAFVEAAGLVMDEASRSKAEDSRLALNGDDKAAPTVGGGTSVASVIRHALGKKWAYVGGVAFSAQMLAVVTAQVVKGAEITSKLTGIPYLAGCLLPASALGLFVFASKPEVVEGFNTALTAMMIGGFFALICTTIASGRVGEATGSLFQRAEWSRFVPNMKVAWAMPVFVKLISFGEAMPLLVERMVQGQTSSKESKEEGDTAGVSRASALLRVRLATMLGSAVPLVMSIVWAAIATALVDPTSSNPMFSLLASGPAIAVPVALLSMGAIGTTLIGAFLAIGHFLSDMIISILGDGCSPRWKVVADILTVAIPCALACLGPSLYLPLLSFAGAYPTTLLYGLAPSVAAIVLRRRAKKEGVLEGAEGTTPRLVPGGEPTLIALAGTAVYLVGMSSILALRHMWRATGASPV